MENNCIHEDINSSSDSLDVFSPLSPPTSGTCDENDFFNDEANTKIADIADIKENIYNRSSSDSTIAEPEEDIYNRPSSDSTIGNKKFFSAKEEQIIKRLEIDIIREIDNQQFEDGFVHPAEEVIKNCFKSHPSLTKRWLQQTFLRNYRYPEVIISILRTIADFDISSIDPECEILCVASLSHKNQEIRETAISVFETWNTLDSVKFLENYNENVSWLNQYRIKIIEEIKIRHGIRR